MGICVDCPPCSISPSYGVFWLRGRIHEKKGRTSLVDGLPKSASPANRILTLYPYQSAPSGSQGELSLCKTHGPSNTDSLSFARWVCSDSRKWLRPFQSYEQWPRKWLVPSADIISEWPRKWLCPSSSWGSESRIWRFLEPSSTPPVK